MATELLHKEDARVVFVCGAGLYHPAPHPHTDILPLSPRDPTCHVCHSLESCHQSLNRVSLVHCEVDGEVGGPHLAVVGLSGKDGLHGETFQHSEREGRVEVEGWERESGGRGWER